MKAVKRQKSLAQIEAERVLARSMDLAAVSLQPEAAMLPQQAEIEVTRAGAGRGAQRVKEDAARRMDAFEALRMGMSEGCYDAARRFEADIRTRRGESDRGRAGERVDCTAGPTTDAMIHAAEQIEAVMKRLPRRDAWLLCELIAPAIDRGTWRDHVAHITGETHTHAQGAAVRAATVNLRDAYAAVERKVAA